MMDFPSISSAREALLNGSISAVQLTEHYLQKAESEDRFNAFLEVFRTSAIDAATKLDEKVKSGEAGTLAGAIIAIKDNICYRGHKLGAASQILNNFESLFTATSVQRLLDEGAIIIGRLNCDEFAMGSSGENSSFGPVTNPLNETLVPGGSSSGSAAAVAAGLCMASLGSDTGGSIRQPASFCGIVGMKPTYGRISRYGLIAFASSFDQIGPLARNVEDAELLYNTMAGKDVWDSTSSSKPVVTESKLKDKPLRFAYMKEVMESPGLKPAVKKAFEAKLDKLRSEGHEVNSFSFPYLDHMVPCYYVLTTAEASSNLGRYDGVHYGQRSEKSEDIPSTYLNSRTEGFGTEVKRRIMLGTFVLSTGYYDAYYSKAQKIRRLIQEATKEVLEHNDFIISPTTPHAAFALGEKSNDPISLYLEDIFTVQANLSGNPSISVPLGENSEGLPFGIQLTGRFFDEADLFAAAQRL